MTKKRLTAALQKAGDGVNLGGEFWDELVTITELIAQVTEEQVAQAWAAVRDAE